MILPDWRLQESQGLRKVVEGQFTEQQIADFNAEGYNVYWRPNYPREYVSGTTVNGSHIDTWEWVFVDMDLKDGAFKTKDDFIATLADFPLEPTMIVDSGNGVHVYWRVIDLDVESYLRIQRRLCRALNTDPAVAMIPQLMRLPDTYNTKVKGKPKHCEKVFETDNTYTCEQLSKALPPITPEDEAFCKQHYDMTFNADKTAAQVSDELPPKFGKLLKSNQEVKDLWIASSDDRSAGDFRLGHLLFANGFTQDEAIAVLANTAKAITRAPVHRLSYAQNIVNKIWTFETGEEEDKKQLSRSIGSILKKGISALKGIRFPCSTLIDNTEHGFRLGQVMGLVAGAGVGKTAFSMNIFRWFGEQNPDYHHFFVALEQPENEIADRWRNIAGNNHPMTDKVHVLSNYDDDGSYRNLSLSEIEEYLVNWQKETKNKVGCVVIDHIGVLKKKGAKDEKQDLIDICHNMKAFAVRTNTFLIMQSQTSREKAGIGDLPLEKDAAYGTSSFEWYVDYLITMHQPLKRCYDEAACPTVTAFKFCKIRHKNTKKDKIKEDVMYKLFFDPETGVLRPMTQDEETSFNYFLPKATNKRKIDRKTELHTYKSAKPEELHAEESRPDAGSKVQLVDGGSQKRT